MLVRRMTTEDIDAVVQIERACFSQPWSAPSFQDSLMREDTIFLVCEMEKNEIAGYIGMYLSFDEASITNVAVSPNYRKRGIGERLVAEAKCQAIEAGASQMILEVRVSNEAAISLYKKKDFAELGIRKKFYEHPVEDAYIMNCELAVVE